MLIIFNKLKVTRQCQIVLTMCIYVNSVNRAQNYIKKVEVEQ